VARLDLPEDARTKYTYSATGQEIIRGALDETLAPDADEHVFGFFRHIEGLPTDKPGNDAATFIDIDENLALSAARISDRYKLAMADSLIYAVGQRFSATIWTQDKDFRKLPRVKYIKKNETNTRRG